MTDLKPENLFSQYYKNCIILFFRDALMLNFNVQPCIRIFSKYKNIFKILNNSFVPFIKILAGVAGSLRVLNIIFLSFAQIFNHLMAQNPNQKLKSDMHTYNF